MKTCQHCHSQFQVTDSDRQFYKRISPTFNGKTYQIPEPTLCPECRLQRRMASRNDRNLYERTCDYSGKKLISMYPPQSKVVVYNKDMWWSDQWDPKAYGREFDFSRAFFDQYQDLIQQVPHSHVAVLDAENSLYTNFNGFVRNCYLCFAGNYLQDSMYCYNAQNSKNCVDSLFVYNSELAYESVHSSNCYNTAYVLNSKNCSDSMFLENCTSCKHCFMSFNLNNKQYCLMNEQLTKEEYEKRLTSFKLNTHFGFQRALEYWKDVRTNYPKRANSNVMSESVSGEYILQSKNCEDCYIMSKDCEDCHYIFNGFPGLKDSYDCTYSGENASLLYEMMGSGSKGSNNLFGLVVVDGSSNVFYSQFMFNSKNCFGCSNMRNAEYCILNKQYTKEEYEEMAPKIIDHMRSTGEWGEYFPVSTSPFSYNQTIAQECFPLTQKEVGAKGWNWLDQSEKEKKPQTYEIPDDINETPDSITSEVLACLDCGKNYRIIQQELAFYRKQQFPIPRRCFDCRHMARLSLRNGRQQYERNCDQCGTGIQTSYSPDRQSTVYCEACYLKEVY